MRNLFLLVYLNKMPSLKYATYDASSQILKSNYILTYYIKA